MDLLDIFDRIRIYFMLQCCWDTQFFEIWKLTLSLRSLPFCMLWIPTVRNKIFRGWDCKAGLRKPEVWVPLVLWLICRGRVRLKLDWITNTWPTVGATWRIWAPSLGDWHLPMSNTQLSRIRSERAPWNFASRVGSTDSISENRFCRHPRSSRTGPGHRRAEEDF